jgi:hypothetical protein
MRAKTSSSSKSSSKTPAKAAPAAAAKKHGVATARKSEPIIALTTRQLAAKAMPELPKKAGELPTPVASFVF